MKKRALRNTIAVIAGGILAAAAISCNFGNLALPKNIAISTEAEYKVKLGDVATLVNKATENLNMDSMLEQVKSSMGNLADMYKYDDGSGTLGYVLHLDFSDKLPDLNINQYISQLNVDSLLQGVTGEGTTGGLGFDNIDIPIPEFSFGNFTIPSINIPDFTSSVTSAMSFPPIDITPVFEMAYSIEPTRLQVRTDSSKEITYDALYIKEGGLKLNFTKTDSTPCGADFSITVTVALETTDATPQPILSAAGTPVVQSTTFTENGEITLNLKDASLPQNFNITIGGTMTGSDASTFHDFNCAMTFTDDFKLDKVTGLNADPEKLGITSMPTIDPTPISLSSMKGMFESATIGAGSKITLQAANPTLTSDTSKYFFESGLNITPTITISGAGLSTSFVDDGNTSGYLIKKICNLSGQTLEVTDGDEEIIVDGSISFNLVDATINFDNGSSATTIPINFDATITKIAEASVNLKSFGDIPTEFDLASTLPDDQKTLPEEMLKFIKRVSFGEQSGVNYFKHDADGNLQTTEAYKAEGLGISCKLKNSLPVGNSIPVHIHSTIFDLDINTSINGNGNDDLVDTAWVDYPNLDFTVYNESNPANIDLTVTMGNKVGDKCLLTVRDIEFGTTYHLGLQDVGFKFDWDVVEANLSSIEIPKEEIDVSVLDLSSTLKNLPFDASDVSKIQIETLPVFFYMGNPGEGATEGIGKLLNGIGLSGTMNIGDTYLLGTAPENEGDAPTPGSVTFVSENAPWSGIQDNTIHAGDAVDAFLTKEKASFGTDLADFVNDTLASAATSSGSSEGSSSGSEGSEGSGSSESSSQKKLMMDYDLHITGASNEDIRIYHAMIPSESSSGSTGSESESTDTGLTMEMAVKLLFQLELTDDVNFNLTSLINSSSSSEEGSETTKKDLLGRTEDNNSLKDFVSATNGISHAAITIDVTGFPLKGLSLGLNIDDTHGGDTDYSGLKIDKTNQALVFDINSETGAGKIDLKLNQDDFEKVFESKYFNPDISVVLEKGELKLSDSLLGNISSSGTEVSDEDKFSAKVTFSVKGSGNPATIPLSIGGNQ